MMNESDDVFYLMDAKNRISSLLQGVVEAILAGVGSLQRRDRLFHVGGEVHQRTLASLMPCLVEHALDILGVAPGRVSSSRRLDSWCRRSGSAAIISKVDQVVFGGLSRSCWRL